MNTYEGIDKLEECLKDIAQYLCEFSKKNNWEIPFIAPYECETQVGACIQWGSDIIIHAYVDKLPMHNLKYIDVDYLGDIMEFDYPSEISQLEMFLLK